MRIAYDVMGDQRRFRVLEVADQGTILRGLAEDRIDLLHGGGSGGHHSQVRDGADQDRHAQRRSGQAPVELGDD